MHMYMIKLFLLLYKAYLTQSGHKGIDNIYKNYTKGGSDCDCRKQKKFDLGVGHTCLISMYTKQS